MSTQTEITLQPSPESICSARRLLRITRELDLWTKKIEDAGIELNEPTSSLYVEMALDLLFLPEDNWNSETGEGNCRDFYYELYDTMVVKHNDIDGFIQSIIAPFSLKIPESANSHSEIEFAIYGNLDQQPSNLVNNKLVSE